MRKKYKIFLRSINHNNLVCVKGSTIPIKFVVYLSVGNNVFTKVHEETFLINFGEPLGAGKTIIFEADEDLYNKSDVYLEIFPESCSGGRKTKHTIRNIEKSVDFRSDSIVNISPTKKSRTFFENIYPRNSEATINNTYLQLNITPCKCKDENSYLDSTFLNLVLLVGDYSGYTEKELMQQKYKISINNTVLGVMEPKEGLSFKKSLTLKEIKDKTGINFNKSTNTETEIQILDEKNKKVFSFYIGSIKMKDIEQTYLNGTFTENKNEEQSFLSFVFDLSVYGIQGSCPDTSIKINSINHKLFLHDVSNLSSPTEGIDLGDGYLQIKNNIPLQPIETNGTYEKLFELKLPFTKSESQNSYEVKSYINYTIDNKCEDTLMVHTGLYRGIDMINYV